MAIGSLPDLLRLVVVPALGWAAWRDVKTRRVTNRLWPPLAALGVALLVVEASGHLPVTTPADRLYLLRVTASLGIVVPLAYLFWRLGGFGGADAKALMTLAVLVPTYPTYFLPTVALPVVRTTLGVFSLTVLTNAVLVGLAYPVALAVRNAVDGELAPAMFLARRVPVGSVVDRPGRLFESTEGTTRNGLDLDALRMYLRWRGARLADLREAPAVHRDPASVGETNAVGDGAVDAAVATDGGTTGAGSDATANGDADDPWAAERFLAEIDGSAYGTTPETLREGLDVLTEPGRDRVWISPGIPFLIPTFGGLVVAFTYGDLLFALLTAVGAV